MLRSRFDTALLQQGIKFILVGVLNTALDAAAYLLLTRFTGFFATRQVWAKAISYAVGVINSFIWNRNWTFRSQASPWRTFAPFFAANLVGVAINSGVMYLAFRLARLPEALSFVLATGVTLLWNFSISKLVIFRR